MTNISPSFKIQCSSFIFRVIANNNVVFKKLIEDFTFKQRKSVNKKEVGEDYKEIAITKLVSKMEIKLTMPEYVIGEQADSPEIAAISSEQDDDVKKSKQAAPMFFIAKGSS